MSRKRFHRTRPAARSSAGGALDRIIRVNRAVSLGRYFRELAQASVAAAALAACGTSHSPPAGSDSGAQDAEVVVVADTGVADAGFDAATPPGTTGPTCNDGRWTPLSAIDPARSYDYLAAYAGICGGCAPEAPILDEDGLRCATAADRPGCESSVAESTGMWQRHLVATEGDEVARYTSEEELRTLLGPVNTADEALLFAWRSGHDIACSAEHTSVRELDDGWEVVATIMTSDCPVMIERRVLHVSRSGEVRTVSAEEIDGGGGCIGRRPEGLQPAISAAQSDPVARFFADVTRLEAGSVDAFQILARELQAHGAPQDLIDEAVRSAEDEVRHAQMMGAVAARLGASTEPPVVEDRPIRSLYALALDNAVEGCVRETWGALVGHHQALAARDGELRRAMAIIAEDETRHASLSWKIAEWAEPQLTDDEREALRQAQRRAVRDLRTEASVQPAEGLVSWAGLPAAREAVDLVDQLTDTLWA